MPLDPQARAFLDDFAAAEIPMPWDVETPAEARRVLAGLQVPPDSPIEVGRVEDRMLGTAVGAVPVRIFTPQGEGPFPVLVWFHGGGWVVGSLDESDTTCRSLCRKAEAIVICPDYRLAPEHRFPAAAEDAYAVTEWIAREGASIGADPARIAVGGDSAGGNLAAVVALMARDRAGPELVFQLLVYPVVGLPSDGRPSYAEFADGYFLTRSGMDWFTELYAGSPEDIDNPYLVPLKAESLAGLPRALVLTAECDPLRDEGEAYALRLQESGVDCRLERYDGQIHAFFILTDQLDIAFIAHDEAARALREAFGSRAN